MDQISAQLHQHGLLCGEIIGVDIDVPVETLAEQVELLSHQVLGATPLKRIGRPPKLLLAFRADRPFHKMQTSDLLLADGTAVRVAVLAMGQQFVAFGIHPETKSPYVWPDHGPLDVPAAELPITGAEECAAFIKQAESLLRGAGGETRAERREIERKGLKAAGVGHDGTSSRETVAEALAHVPNDDLPYDDWIRVGLALYATLGTQARDLWEDWSAQSNKNEADFTAGKWETFASVRGTVGTLFWLAHQNGWRQPRPRDRRRGGAEPRGGDAERDPDRRPVIRVVAGALPDVVDQAERALLAADRSLYQRGSLIVRAAISPVVNAGGRRTFAQRLVHVRAHHLAEAMTAAAQWERYDSRLEAWVGMDCTLRIAETYLAREGLWLLPVLTGLINGPTLRADGSILNKPGYDASTGLLFDPQARASRE